VSANVKLEITGVKELADRFKRLPVNARDELRALINGAALQVHNEAKRNCPVDMGGLRASIQLKYYGLGRNFVGEITTTSGYGAFVEFGTGPLGRSTYPGRLPEGYVHGPGGKMPPLRVIKEWCHRKKIPERAAYVIARKIGKNGLRARPYMGPAFDRAMKDFETQLNGLLSRIAR
jgi:hypothetical protein